ncbi:MAG: hypothetical protein DRJ01_01550 [Bacteroidetes bacterium]|nr:MAG: hypothetical protein DRJ01_01550 [Bacteroidota bacterium]
MINKEIQMKASFKILLSLILFIILNNNLIYADSSKIDSLESQLKKVAEEEQFEIFLQLSKKYRNNSFKKSFYYAQQALKISKKTGNKENEIEAYRHIGAAFKSEGNLEATIEQFEKALAIEKELDNQKGVADIYNTIGDIYKDFDNYDKAQINFNKAIEISKKNDDEDAVSFALNGIGTIFYKQGDYKRALRMYENSLRNYLKLKDSEGIAASYHNIALIHKQLGEYQKALENTFKSLEIYEKLEDEQGISLSYSNIGTIYYYLENNDKAIEFFRKSLAIEEKLGNVLNIAGKNNNIGSVYTEQKKYKLALNFYKRSLKIYEKFNIKNGVAIISDNIGLCYFGMKQYDKALFYNNKSLKIQKEIGNNEGIIYSYNNIGQIYLKKGEFNKALECFNKSLKMSKDLNLKTTIIDSYRNFSELHEAKGSYKKSLEYYKKLTILKDSLLNEESHKQIAEMQTKYETEKKQAEIELLSKDKALKEAEIKKQKYIKNGLILGSIFILIFAFLTYNRFLIKKRSNKLLTSQKNEILEKNEALNQQKEEILSQRDLIEEKNKNLEKAFNTIKRKNKNITDSINYAQKIQNALLPPEHYLNNILNDYFVLFKPKDIVSGDFYWVRQNNNRIIVAAADCTGHGVPGAFMSILGTTFLNEISHLNSNIEANEILNILSQNLKKTLHQTDEKSDTRDGMDIALYIIDTEKQILQFSGAYNPLYLIRNKELCQYKADKMPIGLSYKKEKPFTKHEIKLEKGDSFYIFSDGYIDQFGKNNKEKFKTKRFQELLIRINDMPMSKQKNVLDSIIEKWRGDVEQIDDILVFGVKI